MGLKEIIVFLSCFLLIQGAVVEQFEIDTTRSYINNPKDIEWSNCGPAESPIIVEHLNVQPHPLTPGKLVQLSSVINVTKDIGVKGQNLSLDAALKVKTGVRYRDLCQDLGFVCHIDNFCTLLGKWSKKCEFIFKKPYCECPITAMVYEIKIPPVEFPPLGFYIHGSFVLEVAVKDSTSMLGCLRMEFCLKYIPESATRMFDDSALISVNGLSLDSYVTFLPKYFERPGQKGGRRADLSHCLLLVSLPQP